MRIGIDVRLWSESGVGRYIRNLVSNLSIIDNKNNYVLFALSKDNENLKSQAFSKKFEIVNTDFKWHGFREQFEFPKILKSNNLDIVHFTYFAVPIFYKKPYVVTIHDLTIDHFPTGKASSHALPYYQFKRLGYKRVVKSATNNSKRVIVPSNATKKEIVKHYKIEDDKIKVIKEGVDPGLQRNGFDSKYGDTEFILYVGNAYPHKNLERLLNAFENLKKKKKIELFLVGQNDYFYRKIRDLVTRREIHNVHFLHDIDDKKLYSLYKNASFLVAPSLMEGFGLTPLEAMSGECLVVCSDIPSFREVCSDAALYFDEKSVLDMEKIMYNALTLSTSEKSRYLKKGKERSRKFSWEKTAQETLLVYEGSIGL